MSSILLRMGSIPDTHLRDPIIRSRYAQLLNILNDFYEASKTLLERVYNKSLDEFHNELPSSVLTLLTSNEYLNNIITILGPPGSGKTTLLITFLDRNLRRLMGEQVSILPHERLYIPIGIIDLDLIPKEDTVTSWFMNKLTEVYNMVSNITFLSSAALTRDIVEELNRIKEGMDKSLRELEEAATLLSVDVDETSRILAADVDEYREIIAHITKAGYHFRKSYVKFATSLRRFVNKLYAHVNPLQVYNEGGYYPLITLIIDNVEDVLLNNDIKKLMEVMTLCKLISADPLSTCIISLRQYPFIQYTNEMLLNDILAHYIGKPRSDELRKLTPLAIANFIEKYIANGLTITFSELDIPEVRRFKPLAMEDDDKTLGDLDMETRFELLLPSNNRLVRLLPNNYISLLLYPIRTPRCLEKIYYLEMFLLNRRVQGAEKDIVNNVSTPIQQCSKYFFEAIKGYGKKEVVERGRREYRRSLKLECFETDLDSLIVEESLKYVVGEGSGNEENLYLKILLSASICDLPLLLNEHDYAKVLSHHLRSKLSSQPPLPLSSSFPYTKLRLILPESLFGESNDGKTKSKVKNEMEMDFPFIVHDSVTKSHAYVTLWNRVLREIVDAIREQKGVGVLTPSSIETTYVVRGLIFYIFTLYSLMLITSNERLAKLRAGKDSSNQQTGGEEVLMEDRLIDVLNYILEVENDSSKIRERLEALGREVQTILHIQRNHEVPKSVSGGKVDEAEDLIKTLLENIRNTSNKVVRASGSIIALIFTINVKDWCEEANAYCPPDEYGYTVDSCIKYSDLCDLISSFCKPIENNGCRSLIREHRVKIFIREINNIMTKMLNKMLKYINSINDDKVKEKMIELFFFPLLLFALTRLVE